MATHKLFVYGTLKRGEYNHYRMTNEENGSAVFIGEAKLSETFPLVVEYGTPFLLHNLESEITPDKQPKDIYGELYEVDSPMLKVLDALESHPTWYLRTDTHCILLSSSKDLKEGDKIACQVYFLRVPTKEHYSLPYISNYPEGGHPYIPEDQRQ